MIVVIRFRVAEPAAADFRERAAAALAALAARPGYTGGRLGRNADDPGLWALVTEWEGPGFYRRALSDYTVKVSAVPLLSEALDEPSAYEVLDVVPAPAR
ncbi:antibiotic biosynthesis monooxygenase family protein [Allonocardiopsis opalescens]|uniref:Antibiotic biosynthesis monooxygenase n=1 Tax=Allonocardiopsis opalescens TaxID=1144618 RepID=A0A2T0QFK2_9ACTN|nr:antibiotic biosynthesis monooxygenase [Allonocardiopsis opalescens]PRY02714.1 antibiotic biosynthesis monooxygenase [Allonocardiopsis opalescens]